MPILHPFQEFSTQLQAEKTSSLPNALLILNEIQDNLLSTKRDPTNQIPKLQSSLEAALTKFNKYYSIKPNRENLARNLDPY